MTLHEEYYHISSLVRKCWDSIGTGGNSSAKDRKEIVISASGAGIGGSSCHCRLASLDDVKTEEEYFVKGQELIIGEANGQRPSMEYGFHFNSPHKYVVHTHPADLNVILCSNEAEVIIKNLFHDLPHYFVPYITPGFHLFRYLKKLSAAKIVFLQNHGLIVSDNNYWDVARNLCLIQSRIRDFIFRPLYPDAACLPAANAQVNKTILCGINHLGLTPRFLTESEIKTLKDLEYEKFRSKIKKDNHVKKD